MPELFGITRSSGLNPSQLDSFNAMERDLLLFRPGRAERNQSTFAQLGVISRHPLDHALIEPLQGIPVTVCWAGTPPMRGGLTYRDLAGRLIESGRFTATKLDARWCCVVINEKDRVLWLVSDRHGHCPLYYAVIGDCLAFATKPLTMARAGVVTRSVDVEGLIDLFTYEYCTGDRTLLTNVRVLPQNSMLKYSHRGAQLVALDDAPWLSKTGQLTNAQAAQQVYEGLAAAVRRSTESADSITITLSGGMDSRALLHCGLRTGKQIRALTFGVPDCRDVRFAEEVARKAAVRHTVIHDDGSYLHEWLDYVTYVMGGTVGAVHSHILSLAKELRGGRDIVLDGLSGDMLLGGHVKWHMLIPGLRSRCEKRVFASHARAFQSWEALAEVLQEPVSRQTDYRPIETLSAYRRGLAPNNYWIGYYRFDVLERQRRFIQSGPLLFEPLNHVVAPFYAPEIIEAIEQMNASLLLEQRTYHAVHQRFMRDLAVLPDTLRAVPLAWPMTLRFAKKWLDAARRKLPRGVRAWTGPHGEGTTDWPNWLRTSLRGLVEERLVRDGHRIEAYVRPNVVEQLVREHMTGSANHTQRLGVLLSLDSFIRSME